METSTSENGRTTRDMVKVHHSGPTEINMSESTRTARSTATGLTDGLTEMCTSVSLRMARSTATGLTHGPTEICTSVSIRAVLSTATGLTYLAQMLVNPREANTSVNTRTAKYGKGFIILRPARCRELTLTVSGARNVSRLRVNSRWSVK